MPSSTSKCNSPRWSSKNTHSNKNGHTWQSWAQWRDSIDAICTALSMTYQDHNNLHCKTQYPTSIATDGQVIINLPKTAKADADERCKHHTWSHHFELQTSQSEEPVSIQPHCRKKDILTLDFIICTNAQMRWIENFFMTLCKESAPALWQFV
jgi:hypothetical protein